MIAIFAALGLVGVLTITVVTTPVQEAEARGCENGQAGSVAFNASKGRCFGH